MGAAKCGKTAVINSFIENTEYEEEYLKTLFIDKYENEMQMVDPTDGLSRNLNITVYDIGAENFTGELMRENDGLVACFDLTD